MHSTQRWGEQAILLCMVYMALISASLAVRTDTHIRVMLIDYLLPKAVIGFLKGMSHVMIFGFSLFMIIYGFQFTALMGKSVMSGLGCKQSFLYALVPIATNIRIDPVHFGVIMFVVLLMVTYIPTFVMLLPNLIMPV